MERITGPRWPGTLPSRPSFNVVICSPSFRVIFKILTNNNLRLIFEDRSRHVSSCGMRSVPRYNGVMDNVRLYARRRGKPPTTVPF